MLKRFGKSLSVYALLFMLGVAPVMADTIRLKNGSVIRGQIIGFRDQQFVVLVGDNARGRRSQVLIYMEDVDTVEFDNAGNAAASANTPPDIINQPTATAPPRTTPPANTTPTNTATTRPANNPANPTNANPPRANDNPGNGNTAANSGNVSDADYFRLTTKVLANDVANGWTNTGLVVRRGQRIRVNARGSISLGGGRVSTPAGVSSIRDPKKLMPTVPTGGLIAVIGDDNDDFIFIGNGKEFVAQRDGALFLGVNEDNLSDNSGNYEANIEAGVRDN